MPSVFEDFVGSDDLLIPNSTQWSPSNSPGLANGDIGYRPNATGASAYIADTGGKYLPALNASGDSGFTVEVNYKVDQANPNPTQQGFVVRHGDSPYTGSSQNWLLGHSYERFVTNTYYFYYFNNAGTGTPIWQFGPLTVSGTPWFHLVFTFVVNSNTTIKGRHWRDGALVQDYVAPASTVGRRLNATTRLTIGDGIAGSGNRGEAKLAIYPREFTQVDVDKRWASLSYV